MAWKLTSIALFAATALGVACVTEGPTGIKLDQPGSSGDSSNPTSSGGPTTGSGTQAGAARDMFITQVYVSLMNEPTGQTCGSCHNGTLGPQYLVGNPEGSYTLIESKPNYIGLPDNSILYLHGLTAHTGPGYTMAQAELIKAWLQKEAEERKLAGGTGGTGTTGGPTLAQAVEEFGNCMSLTDWTDNGLQELCNMQVDGGQRCKDCHSTGQNNTWLGVDVETTFEMNTQFPYIMRLVSGTVDETGNFSDLVESKRFQQKGQEACINPPCHPKFELDDQLKAGLHQFYALTKLKYDEGPCMGGGVGGGGGAGGGQ